MRTKNKKWTVPILAIVPVLTLAAFLAVGYLISKDALALESDTDCGFEVTGPSAGTAVSPTATDGTEDSVCYSLTDSIEVKLQNTSTEDLKAAVLVSGGSDFSDAQIFTEAQLNGPDADDQAVDEDIAKGVDQYYYSKLESSDPIDPTYETITISKSNAKDGSVSVILYTAAGNANIADFPIAKDAELRAASPRPTASLRIIFLGSPSRTVLDTEECLNDDGSTRACNEGTDDDNGDGFVDPDTKPDVGSTLEIAGVEDLVGVSAVDGEKGMYTIDETGTNPSTTSPLMLPITATIKDNNARLLRDGNEDIDSTVTFSYEYAMGSSLKPRRLMTAEQEVDVDPMGQAMLELDDWKTTGAVSVTVSAMYSGPTGNLDLGEVTISRGGDPVMIVGAAFSVGCLKDQSVDNNDEPDPTADLGNDTFVMKDNKACVMDARFGKGQTFIVKAHLEDSLGTVVGGNLTVALDDDVEDPLDPTDGATLDNPPANAVIQIYEVDEDTMLGDHMITYSSTADDVEDLVITVSVAGSPDSFMISGPDRIGLNGSGVFTIQAYDEEMGIPHFAMDDPDTNADESDDMVVVFIQGIAPGNTRGISPSGIVDLDEDTGTGTFAIYAPNGAMDGDTIRIFVGSGDMEQMHEVTFGEPGATPGPMETDEFTADYTVDATSTAGSGMVDVSWTRSEELSLSLVSLIQGDDVVDFTVAVGTSAQFSEVDPGEYDVSVFSLRNNADGKDGEIAFGTVTVE